MATKVRARPAALSLTPAAEARIAALMARVTGEEPRAWGKIIGFGRYRYRYGSGREGETFRVGFAPRAGSLVLYLPGDGPERARLAAALGDLKTGAGCVYVKRLADVDAAALEALVAHVHANPPDAA